MTSAALPPDELLRLAEGFADDVSQRLGRVVPLADRLTALTAGDDEAGRVSVAVWDPVTLKARAISLMINGKPTLRLYLKFNCCWDRGKDYLAVDASWFHVRIGDREKDEPLFRYEYLRRPVGLVPAAHLQIHAHRDEFVYLLVASDKGRPKMRQRKDEVPRLSLYHFPLGGHRFRPCLEDILESLILEFGIDRLPNWRSAVEEGRESWRRTQLKAAVRDAPTDAATTLTALGWTCTPPDAPSSDSLHRLTAF